MVKVLDNRFNLRADQQEYVNKLVVALEEGKRSRFEAPTSYGKTAISLKTASKFKLPVTYLLATYSNTETVIKEINNLYTRAKPAICVPLGKARLQTVYCKSSCTNCPKKTKGRLNNKGKRLGLKRKDFKGQVIDANWVLHNYPDVCPYVFLRHYVNKGYFDFVITHYTYLTSSTKVKTKGFLIVDEIQKPASPQSFQISRYLVAEEGRHLESTERETELEKLLWIIGKLLKIRQDDKEYRERIISLKTFVEAIFSIVQPSVVEVECNALLHGTDSFPTAIDLSKTEIEVKLSSAIGLYKETAQAGFRYIADIANHRHKVDWLKEATKIGKADLTKAGLSDEEIGLAGRFFHVMWNQPTFSIHSPNTGLRKDYIEIHAVTHKGDIESIYGNYEKILEITATPPYNLLSDNILPKEMDTQIIKVDSDPNCLKKMIIFVPKDEWRTLVPLLLRKNNLLGAVKSKNDIQYAKARYGGQSLGSETSQRETYDVPADDVQKLCRDKKGLIFWIVNNSSLSISNNSLGCLDGCIVESCMQRDPATEENPDEYMNTQTQHLYQLISRIFRSENGFMRKGFVLIHDVRVFEALKMSQYKGWLTFAEAKDANEALRIIQGHAEPYPIKPPQEVVENSDFQAKIQEHKQKGKDGKERSYRYIRIMLPQDSKLKKDDIIRGSYRFEATDQKVTSKENDQASPSLG